ncbi:MAG: MBL fold metallo-hydrolase [Acidobacteria bacterium]|nr:MBL fold metallo-hydrolase [Acidobacteriota bacterium]
MRRFFVALLAAALAPAALLTAQSRALDIYWIDVEGGASTLIVAPSGESMLVDTGYETDGRDAKRIHAAAQQAGLKQLDHVVISHYHGDHVGGLAALATMIPIGRVYTRGDKIAVPADQKWYDSMRAVSAGRRTIVAPGDKIPIKGVDVLVVSSDHQLLPKPANGGGPNALCANAEQKAPAGFENQAGVGLLLTYNRFTFLNLIDFDWATEMELACPINKVGAVTLFQSNRHGAWEGAGAPAFLGAIRPQVVVFNNGPRKGLGQVQEAKVITPPGVKVAPYERNGYARAAALPGIEGIWQGHLSLLDKDPKHNTSPDMIANFEETAECKGHFIRASVQANGQFTMMNGRNGFSRSYKAR